MKIILMTVGMAFGLLLTANEVNADCTAETTCGDVITLSCELEGNGTCKAEKDVGIRCGDVVATCKKLPPEQF